MKVNTAGIGINQETKSYKNNTNSAEQIREKRRKLDLTKGITVTADMYENLGLEKVVYPQYTKFAVINTPCSSTKKEMKEVMDGYYDGTINEEDIKGFFMEYCSIQYARDEDSILNVYESFLNENYASAVAACFEDGRNIARKEGLPTDHLSYYNADYYYKSEKIHDLLKEAAKEYGQKYGIDVDVEKRDESFPETPNYLTGFPDFNSKWNFMATNMYGRGRMMDLDAVPPKGFSFFYKEGTDSGTKDTLLIIGGNGWSEKVNVPFEMPTYGKDTIRYFYLSDLYQVSKEQEEEYEQYNDFLKKHIISR